MNLARMHDIGGCRAVLPSQAAVDRVVERLMMQRRWEFRGSVYDYVAAPKPDGYRAKHLVVVKDGVLIEVQLRTEAQHRWAELVERFDREYGLGLKSGRAAPWAHELFALGSRLLEMQERGELAPSAMMEELHKFAKRADHE